MVYSCIFAWRVNSEYIDQSDDDVFSSMLHDQLTGELLRRKEPGSFITTLEGLPLTTLSHKNCQPTIFGDKINLFVICCDYVIDLILLTVGVSASRFVLRLTLNF